MSNVGMEIWMNVIRTMLGFFFPILVCLLALHERFAPLVWLRRNRQIYTLTMGALLLFETWSHVESGLYYMFLFFLAWFLAYPATLFVLRAVGMEPRFDGTYRRVS